jgi:catechol 2,3-dioxygenase-like lactoylglutathione lyase family enzyme
MAKARRRPARRAPARGRAVRKTKSTGGRSATRRRTASAKAPARRRERRHRTPETLRLRSIEPSFTVNDLARSIAFYTDVLGFSMGERWTEGDVLKGVMLKAGSCGVGLSQDDWAKGRDRVKGVGMRIWCTTTQDIDALAARVRGAAGRITEGPADQMGGRTLSVVDPDGFQISFFREQGAR